MMTVIIIIIIKLELEKPINMCFNKRKQISSGSRKNEIVIIKFVQGKQREVSTCEHKTYFYFKHVSFWHPTMWHHRGCHTVQCKMPSTSENLIDSLHDSIDTSIDFTKRTV